MNENELYDVIEKNFDDPLITEIDSIIDKCFRDCYNNYFHNLKYRCLYDIKHKNITNNGIFNLPISDKSMHLYELNKKLTVARQRSYIFNQKNKLTIKIVCTFIIQ